MGGSLARHTALDLTVSKQMLINVPMWTMGIRLLPDQPSRSLGTLVAVVLSAFLMAQQVATFLGILGRVAAFADGTAVDVWIASATTVDVDITGTVPVRWRSAAAGTPGVAWAEVVVQGMSRATRPDGARELVKVVGVAAPRYLGLPATLVDTTRMDLRAPGRLFIDEGDRPLYGHARPGDRIEVGSRTMVVGGFFRNVEAHANYGYVYANEADARAIVGLPEDRATFVAVALAPGEERSVVAGRLRSRLPEAKVYTAEELRAAQVGQFMQRTPVGAVFGLGTAVAALVGSLVVGVTMFSAVVDRARDIGTLLAIGATPADVRRLVLGQGLAFAGVGTAVGLAAFGLVKAHATSAPMLAPPWMLAAVALVSVASCMAASLVAVRRAASVDPAIVFKG